MDGYLAGREGAIGAVDRVIEALRLEVTHSYAIGLVFMSVWTVR